MDSSVPPRLKRITWLICTPPISDKYKYYKRSIKARKMVMRIANNLEELKRCCHLGCVVPTWTGLIIRAHLDKAFILTSGLLELINWSQAELFRRLIRQHLVRRQIPENYYSIVWLNRKTFNWNYGDVHKGNHSRTSSLPLIPQKKEWDWLRLSF